MEYIVKHVAGSVMYGLNSEDSDLDLKGVYVNRDDNVLFGLETDKGKQTTSEDLDISLFELRRFFQLLRKTNTNAVETLYVGHQYIQETSETFDRMRKLRHSLINSKQLLSSVTGYMHGEFRYVSGERSGQLGGKRKADLEKYGYSFKSLVHMKRLLHAAKSFFSGGDFLTEMDKTPYYEELMDMKLHPENLTKEQAVALGQDCIEKAKLIKDEVNCEFDDSLACSLMRDVYL